ncbi:hypothetical protein Ancab_006398 [Ancistrocladus abbreviatus]
METILYSQNNRVTRLRHLSFHNPNIVVVYDTVFRQTKTFFISNLPRIVSKQYLEMENAWRMEKQLNGIWIGSYKIQANVARYQRNRKQTVVSGSQSNRIQTAQVLRNLGVSSEGHGTGSNGNKQRSYAEVVNSTAQTRDSKKETWTQIKNQA